jgi:hypothetical protein
MLLDTVGFLDDVELVQIGDPMRAAAQLAAGEVDALVIIAEQGHAGLAKLMETSDFALLDLADLDGANLSLRYPVLRPAHIPANTYPRQDQPLNTISSQEVLATRVPPQQGLLGESGSGVFTRLPQRLPFDTALRPSEVLDRPEKVDPPLPASPGLSADTPPKQRFTADVVSAVLSGLAVRFLVCMIVLFMRPLPKEPELRAESLPPTD